MSRSTRFRFCEKMNVDPQRNAGRSKLMVLSWSSMPQLRSSPTLSSIVFTPVLGANGRVRSRSSVTWSYQVKRRVAGRRERDQAEPVDVDQGAVTVEPRVGVPERRLVAGVPERAAQPQLADPAADRRFAEERLVGDDARVRHARNDQRPEVVHGRAEANLAPSAGAGLHVKLLRLANLQVGQEAGIRGRFGRRRDRDLDVPASVAAAGALSTHHSPAAPAASTANTERSSGCRHRR
jgi:hypothetical protein